ncbi:MAG TPA: tRNA lysidine(34) synthetase TilS [Bacillota bacterium]|nr:tRNA lysidine(34) synthetase TilS [Bacillota bacterium]
MEQVVGEFMRKHRLLKHQATVLIGVSGGPDSMALLHFYHSIRKRWGLRVIALSMNHQLRGKEGLEDLRYVKQMCNEWEIEYVGTSLNVPAYQKKHRVSTQVAAREVRYQFFREQMEKYEADYLALGHHGDDQIETMIMHFTRTANSASFLGIPVKRRFASGWIVRPLLCVTKQTLESYCRKHDIRPKIDPSNEETDYTRNYFRKHVVPILKGKNHNLHVTIQRLSETLHDDELFMKSEAKRMVTKIIKKDEDGKSVRFKIAAFKSYPTALQRRAYHLILNYLYDELPKNLSYIHEDDFFRLLESKAGHVQIDFPRDLKVKRSYEQIILSFESSYLQDPSFHKTIDVPGKTELPDGSIISATYMDEMDIRADSRYTYVCAVEQVSFPLHIRTRQAGDRMTWKGLNGSKKIKDIFIDAKIPSHKRYSWPIVTDNNGKILWLVGLKKRDLKTSEKNETWIQLKYHQKGNT